MAAAEGRRRRRWRRRWRRRRQTSLRPPPSGRSHRCFRAAESRCTAPPVSVRPPLPKPVLPPTPTPVAPRLRLASWAFAGTWAYAPPHSDGSCLASGGCPVREAHRASCLVAESGRGLRPRAASQAPPRLRAPLSGCEAKSAARATAPSRGRRPAVVAVVAVAWSGRRAVHSLVATAGPAHDLSDSIDGWGQEVVQTKGGNRGPGKRTSCA